MNTNQKIFWTAIGIILVVLLLSGCANTRNFYNDPERAHTSESAKVGCADPVDIPNRDLTETETLELWGIDRAELGDCGDKNKMLTKSLTVIERRK